MADMVNVSGLGPLYTALVSALRGDAQLQSWLHERPTDPVPDDFKRVYDDGAVPADLVGRWVTLGDASEGWERWFMSGGSSSPVTLHLWHTPVDGDDVGKGPSFATWAHVSRILSERLTLTDGWVMLSAVATLTTLFKDPDGQSWHGIVRYETVNRVQP